MKGRSTMRLAVRSTSCTSSILPTNLSFATYTVDIEIRVVSIKRRDPRQVHRLSNLLGFVLRAYTGWPQST